jgi:outer membrane protein assembly factor BamB
MGPLALLAALFPAVFGGMAFFMRRWMALLSIACLQSTLYWLHHWFQNRIQDYWWGTSAALWIILAVLSVIGFWWSWKRHGSAATGPKAETMQLKRGDVVVLRVLSLVGLAIVFYCLGTGDWWFPPWKRETVIIWTAIWAGTIYAMILLYRSTRRAKEVKPPMLAPEGIMLGVLGLAFAYLGSAGQRSLDAISQAAPAPQAAMDPVPQLKGVVGKFEPKKQGNFSSSPLVSGDRIYQGAFLKDGFSAFGAVYCVDRITLQKVWEFDDDGDLKPVFSSPCLADGRLYIGEGFHQDSNCKLYCLDAATGKKLWDFPTASHTESSPYVAGGKVFFGAGDDGVFCLDAKTGKELWHFQGLHVDTNLTIAGHRVFGGSGYNGNAIFCLDVSDGHPLWKHPVDLPCFASPTRTAGERVIFGLGNGDFINSDENPAGAILCVDVKTGETIWRFDVPDAVHGKPAVDRRHVYFGSRDGSCYCLDKENGELVWKQSLGSPIVASVVLARCPHCGTCTGLYAAASAGKIACLGVNSGRVNWMFDVARDSQNQAQILSTPAVILEADENGQRSLLYLGSGVSTGFNSAAVLYCIEDELRDH